MKRILGGEGPLRKLLEERMKKGPLLKRLREQFFSAASKVYDADRFHVSLLDDIKTAKGLVVIISPFLNKLRVEKFINAKEVKEALGRGIRIVVVTRPPEPKEVSNVDEHKECIKALEDRGIKTITIKEPKLHFKAVIIDNEIIYLGSINPLSIITIKEIPADYMIRFESEALVDEIIENAIGKDVYEQ
ncbi:MAG: hypothetical protein DRN15_11125 [Thermoprotei archaeon]|nr:MAG: hypothetical protein DRN15_11125 [Thermoprotei archaeon]